MIRLETAEDHGAVRQLLLACFPGSEEADLVARLRQDGDAIFSLVGTDDGRVVGQAMFSPVAAPFRALGLGPVAVLPDSRRRGIAARLIEDGIRRAREAGYEAIFVLGDPDYYRRFGFSATKAASFSSPYAGPYLMALALMGDDLPASTGRIEYATAFSVLGEAPST